MYDHLLTCEGESSSSREEPGELWHSTSSCFAVLIKARLHSSPTYMGNSWEEICDLWLSWSRHVPGGGSERGRSLNPDSVTNVCSTGNHSGVSSVWSGTEKHFPVDRTTPNPGRHFFFFYDCVINYFGNKTGFDKHGAVSGTVHLHSEELEWRFLL